VEDVAERQQQIAGLTLVARAPGLEHMQGAPVVPGCLLEGELRGRPVARRRRVANCLLGPAGARQEIVMGELREMRLEVE
jgi:hypothetical protein